MQRTLKEALDRNNRRKGLNMAYRANPKTNKYCAFCQYWDGEANLVIKGQYIEFESGVYGKCIKQNMNRQACYNGCFCKNYTPNQKAQMML